jgi:GDP-mannose 6-dehydrogenase
MAEHSDLDLPLLGSLLASNQGVIERTVRQVIASGARSVGLIGLSFKPSTDDLRESPFVEIAERLLGKGYRLRIYDPNVFLARLTGSNKEYIEQVIPHLSRLLVSSLDDLASADLVLVAHRYPGVDPFLEDAGAAVLDLANPARDRMAKVLKVGEEKNLDSNFASC